MCNAKERKMKHFISRNLAICVVLALALLGCVSPGNNTPTSLPPTNDMATGTPSGGDVTPTAEVTATAEATETAGEPGTVTVEGDISVNFQASAITAVSLVDTVMISMLDTDNATGVMIFLPADIQPGTYDVGDLYNEAEAEVTARYDSLEDSTVTSYESVSGTLTLTETGTTFSGTFTFEAVNAEDGTGSITVSGSFQGVATLGQ
jgi:hypothetical protein